MGIQDVLYNIGNFGCYFLCLIKAERMTPTEIVEAYHLCVDHKLMALDCFVFDPVRISRHFVPEIPVTAVKKVVALEPGKRVFANDGVHFWELDPRSGTLSYNPLTGYKLKAPTSYRVLN